MAGILSDISAAAESLFLSGSWVFLGMVVLALFFGVSRMRSISQILCVSVLGLSALGVVWVLYGGVTSGARADLGAWIAQLNAGWAALSAISATTLIGYLIAFAIGIAVLFAGKSIFFR